MSIEAKQSTPHDQLISELMDSRISKNEREHAAAREIEQLRQAIAEAEKPSSAIKTLKHLGYTDCGGEYWKPPLGKMPEVQEPVATDWERIARVQDAKLRAMCNEAGGFEKLCEVMDKYERTTPPQRQWVGLTLEDMAKAFADAGLNPDIQNDELSVARAIEAKLKEKNT